MVDMSRGFLARRLVPNPRLEAELLVAHALGLERLGLFLRLDQPVNGAEVDRARDALVRRGRREPVAYITGVKEFYGRRFAVGPGCLVPRPETELLVDRVRELARERSLAPLRVLDVGTGSGCIAVTLALELAGASVTGVDVSEDALVWARRNAETLGAVATLVHGDALAALDADPRLGAASPFDVVVSNPPYVEPEEAPTLSPEVREHEPLAALFAPAGDPDHFARELMARARRVLAPGGVLLVELGHRQARRVLALAQGLGLDARVHDDLAGIPRVLEVTVPLLHDVRRT
jgi:release factor glutamine methyltransferase